MFTLKSIRLSFWLSAMLFASVPTALAQGPLLKPTGMWGVGRATTEVVDSRRTMPNSGAPRRLMLDIWYPTEPSGDTVKLPYMERLEGARDSLTNDELNLLKAVRTHSSSAPAARPIQSRFPVLLFPTVNK